MKMRNTGNRATLTALLWLAAAGTTQASENSAGRFVMTVYEDMAQGRAILEGSADEVIDVLMEEKGAEEFSFEENVNLCVAFTQVKRIREAMRACDAAVSASHEKARRIRRTASPVYTPVREAKDVLAIALGNRGVLHAITGEREQARELFEKALDLQSRRSRSVLRTSTAGNLALLDADLAGAG